MRHLSIIVPTLNEAENIDPLLSAVFQHAEKNALEMELIVVDDGSTDATCDLVREWQQKRAVRLIERSAKDGLAGAVLAGAHAAVNEVVLVMDADLSHPPEMIATLAAPIFEGTADMVIGSRYARGGATPGWPWSRRLASRIAAALAWPLTEVRDALSGYFAVRRKLLLDIPAGAAGFKIALELLVRGGQALRVIEVPIHFRDRLRGVSKMSFRVIWTYLVRLFALASGPRGR